MGADSYREAGVDIAKGERFARFIQGMQSPAIGDRAGGFAGGVELDPAGYRHPVLLSATDGVGTKLLVARELGRWNTIGIDLVAMCANDLLVAGAKPLTFSDYIACGTIDEHVLEPLMEGIVSGCEQAGCSLAGGETAEMPDLYEPGDLDIAGFCTGIVEREQQLPHRDRIAAGDLLYALPSSGIHANGLSLARRVVPKERWEALLEPTRIYASELLPLLEDGSVKAAAHITGGGLVSNVARVLPQGLHPSFRYDWPVPEVFAQIQEAGELPDHEMHQVFNMGLGVVMVVAPEDGDPLEATAEQREIGLLRVGEVRYG